MCGIAGIHAYLDVAPPVDRAELARINDRMAARGPDGSGLWLAADGRTGLRPSAARHHRPVARPARSRCTAPTAATPSPSTARSTITASCAPSSRRAGYAFRSGSDTEVLLQLYADCGADDGRASCAACSPSACGTREQRTLLLARDPLGIKPLYWADDGWTVRFASQAKALLAGGAVSRDPDPAGIVGFHLFGSVPEPFTVWREIRALPAGTTLIDRRRRARRRRSATTTSPTRSAERASARRRRCRDARRQLGATRVRDSVRHHLVADVPVAVFLSAGLDSGALLGTMAELGARDRLGRHAGLRRIQGRRRSTRRRSPPRSPRATARAISCARSIAPSSSATCRRSSTRWTCRPSTASTPGSSPRPRTRRASRSR